MFVDFNEVPVAALVAVVEVYAELLKVRDLMALMKEQERGMKE